MSKSDMAAATVQPEAVKSSTFTLETDRFIIFCTNKWFEFKRAHLQEVRNCRAVKYMSLYYWTRKLKYLKPTLCQNIIVFSPCS